MRFSILVFLFSIITSFSFAQEDFNLELLANVPFPGEDGNDIWGYVDQNGIEYALCGATNSTKIFSLEDPSNPRLVISIPGQYSIWRDLKSYNGYIYVTADQGGSTEGLLIIDMNDPDDISWTNWNGEIDFNGITGTLNRCHNLYIDKNGICYLAGCPGIGKKGVIMLDLNQDPNDPVVVGIENSEYAHDVYARGDTMYVSQIEAAPGRFGVYDVRDKANPILLSTAVTSSSFTHNAWVSTDGKTLFTTDEVANGYVDSWDISDMDNPVMLDKYQPLETQGTGVIPHNTHVMGDYIITSWYTDGVVINDVCDPSNIIKVAAYDTYDGAEVGFYGCWGVYPYLPSGLVIATDINSGLWVLKPTYLEPVRLEGVITDQDTGQPVNGVSVEILSQQANTDVQTNQELSSPTGEYKTGITVSGIYNVKFSKEPEYEDKIVEVLLVKDAVECNINTLNTTMQKRQEINIMGSVVRDIDGELVPDAKIFLDRGDFQYELQPDANGFFNSEILTGDYKIIAAAWGYLHEVEELSLLTPVNLEFRLTEGYQDDFIFDLGWESSGTASVGAWERGIPQEAFLDGVVVTPSADVPSDFGSAAYITGIEGGVVAANDVDNGSVILSSPLMDLTTYDFPHIQGRVYFFNGGGTEAINDTLIISISNGTEEVELDRIFGTGSGAWSDTLFYNLKSKIEITDQMQFRLTTSDLPGSGHIVKAGFDEFLVGNGIIISTNDPSNVSLSVHPNPTSDQLNIFIEGQRLSNSSKLLLSDLNGRVIKQMKLDQRERYTLDVATLAKGMYLLSFMDQGKVLATNKVIKL